MKECNTCGKEFSWFAETVDDCSDCRYLKVVDRITDPVKEER